MHKNKISNLGNLKKKAAPGDLFDVLYEVLLRAGSSCR